MNRGNQIKQKWDLIPNGIDILITHGPPYGHGDKTIKNENCGCVDLMNAIKRVQPRVHIFGHIHEGYGVTKEGNTIFINASSLNVNYKMHNKPVVFEI